MTDLSPDEPEVIWDGADRRAVRTLSLPRWLLATLLILAWLAIMVPVGYIVVTSNRAEDRAERAGRTACELAHGLGDLASAFDRTLSLLGGETRETAEREMREPIQDGYDTSDAAVAETCTPGPEPEQ